MPSTEQILDELDALAAFLGISAETAGLVTAAGIWLYVIVVIILGRWLR
jgi:hypothetical protein